MAPSYHRYHVPNPQTTDFPCKPSAKLKAPLPPSFPARPPSLTFAYGSPQEYIHAFHCLPILLGRRPHQPDVCDLALPTAVRATGKMQADRVGKLVTRFQAFYQVQGPIFGLHQPYATELRARAGDQATGQGSYEEGWDEMRGRGGGSLSLTERKGLYGPPEVLVHRPPTGHFHPL